MSRHMRPLSQRLRTLALPKRHQSTESSSTTATTTTAEATPQIGASSHDEHAEILSYIKSHDPLALSKAKIRLNALTARIQQVDSLIHSQILPSASQIHLSNTTIPPYTPVFWKSTGPFLSRATNLVLERARKIEENLSDLEVINYPSDAEGNVKSPNNNKETFSPSSAHHLKELENFHSQSRSEQELTLWDLNRHLEAHTKRFDVALKSYEKDVDALVRETIHKTSLPVSMPTFQKNSLAENVKSGRKTSNPPVKAAFKIRRGKPHLYNDQLSPSDGSIGENDSTTRTAGESSVGIVRTVMSGHREGEQAAVATAAAAAGGKDKTAVKQQRSVRSSKDKVATTPAAKAPEEVKPAANVSGLEAMQARLEAEMNK